jgi:hypothetical protein
MRSAVYPLLSIFILAGACREKDVSRHIPDVEKVDSAHGERESGPNLDPESVTQDCKSLLARKGHLSVSERKRQIEVLAEACGNNPSHVFQTLRELSDTDDIEVTKSVLRKLMEGMGQEAVVTQMLDLADVTENKPSNRLMVAAIEALASSPELTTQTISLLKKFVEKTGQAGALASLVRMRGRAFGPDEAMRIFGLMDLKGKTRDETVLGISSLLLESNPAEALKLAVGVSQADGSGVLQQLFEGWFEKDPTAATNGFASLGWKQIASCCKNPLVVNKILDSGGEEILRMSLEKMPMTESGLAEAGPLLNVLAKRDLNKTMEFIRDLPASPGAQGLVEQVFTSLSAQNPDMAMQQASTMSGDMKASALKGAIHSLAVKNFDAAIEFAENSESSSKAGFYREIGRAMVTTDPEKAVRMLGDSKISGIVGADFRSEMLDHTVRVWAKNDLAAARSWVEDLPDTDLPKGVQGLMNPWMKSDPIAASDWLAKLPAGSARDAGARVIIEQIKNTDPQMAEQWRNSLSQSSSGQN